MLAFIVPIKSKRIAKSWDYVSRLFERTLRSLCAQTSREFKVIVVCHELPAITFDHPAVSYIEADWEPPPISEFNALLKDKGRKLAAGISAARRFAPTRESGSPRLVLRDGLSASRREHENIFEAAGLLSLVRHLRDRSLRLDVSRSGT
jgi:hypothetical protein